MPLDALGPDRDGCEGRRLGATQDHDTADHPLEGAALDIEPVRGEGGNVGRMEEPRPEARVDRLRIPLTRTPRVGDRPDSVVFSHSSRPSPPPAGRAIVSGLPAVAA